MHTDGTLTEQVQNNTEWIQKGYGTNTELIEIVLIQIVPC